jgi:hypothetical protein
MPRIGEPIRKPAAAVEATNGHAGNNSSVPGEAKRTNLISQGERITNDLQKLRSSFFKHYYFSDKNVVDLVLGTVAGNHFDSDPVWLHIIGPPSSGKTELLYSTFACDETYALSDFTAASLISGYRSDREGDDDQEDEFSLLPKLDGKTVITKDFSLIHAKPAETRAQILSILRDVYDGYASRALGNSEPKGFHARFNYLTGMTPDIETSWSLNTLGERFLLYRIQIDNRRAHARRSLRNANSTGSIRNLLQTEVKNFVDSVPKDLVPKVDAEMVERTIDLADLLATCRTYVHRERNDEISYLPLPELASRVAKQLLRIGQSVALIRGKDRVSKDEFAIMKRIALDSLPTNRFRIIKALWEYRDHARLVETFEAATGLARTTTKRVLDDLNALGAVIKTTKRVSGTKNATNKSFYALSPAFKTYCANVEGITLC